MHGLVTSIFGLGVFDTECHRFDYGPLFSPDQYALAKPDITGDIKS
jgi:hypothetical protein